MLSIFSYPRWSSVFLGKMAIQLFCLFYNQFFFQYIESIWAIHIFRVLSPFWSCYLEIFFLIEYCFPGGAVGKNPPANAGDISNVGLIPGLGRSPGGGNGNPLQDSYLENPMGRGAWPATVQGVAKSWTWLSTHTPLSHSVGFLLFCCWFALLCKSI